MGVVKKLWVPTHACVMTKHADVKELIPEFYNPNLDFDFLINTWGLQLGATQSGERVNDGSNPTSQEQRTRIEQRRNVRCNQNILCDSCK